jgi:hypothetical protein
MWLSVPAAAVSLQDARKDFIGPYDRGKSWKLSFFRSAPDKFMGQRSDPDHDMLSYLRFLGKKCPGDRWILSTRPGLELYAATLLISVVTMS